jgi:hypothetical protein
VRLETEGGTVHIERRVVIGGIEVRPGAVWPMHLQGLRFQGRFRCESAGPEAYVAELLFANEVLISTDPHPSHNQAEKALQKIVGERLRALLGG